MRDPQLIQERISGSFGGKHALGFSLRAAVPVALLMMFSGFLDMPCAFAAGQQAKPEPAKSEPAKAAPVPSPLMVADPQADATAGANEVRESLTDLRLAPGGLPSQPPFLVQRDENEQFTREFYRVQWRSGDPIDLYVILPAHVAKPPVTLFLYGFPSDTNRFQSDLFCEMVTKRGYAAVGFVSALTGHRFHDRGLTDWFVAELPSALVWTVHDVQMILNYLNTRTDLDASRIGMLGQGSGGSIAALAASVEPRLKRVELVDPWGDWPEWLAKSRLILADERPALTKESFVAQAAGVDPLKVLPGLQPDRLELIDVLYDRDTPEAAKMALEAALPKGAELKKYATREEFQAKALDGGELLSWIQPEMLEKSDTPR